MVCDSPSCMSAVDTEAQLQIEAICLSDNAASCVQKSFHREAKLSFGTYAPTEN